MRKISAVTLLAVLALIAAGTAVAGTTTVVPAVPIYAREAALPGTAYTLPAGSIVPATPPLAGQVGANTYIRHAMLSAQGNTDNFYVDITLLDGATWGGSPLTAAKFGYSTTMQNAVGCTITTSLVSGGTVGASTVRYLISFAPLAVSDCAPLAPGTLAFAPQSGTATTIVDVNNAMYTQGSISANFQLTKAATLEPIEGGAGVIMQALDATSLGGITATTATIDVTSTNRANFVPGITVNDTITVDKSGVVYLRPNPSGYLLPNGTGPWAPVAADCWEFTLTTSPASLAPVKAIWYGGEQAGAALTATEKAGNTVVRSVPGNDDDINVIGSELWIEVDGTTELFPTVFNLTVKFKTACGTVNVRTLSGANDVKFTTWKYNGTVLVAPLAQGNTGAFLTRFHVSIPTSSQGAVGVIYEIYDSPVDAAAATLVTKGQTTLAITAGVSRVLRLEDLLEDGSPSVPDPYLGPEGKGNLFVRLTVLQTNAVGVVNIVMPNAPQVSAGTYVMFNQDNIGKAGGAPY